MDEQENSLAELTEAARRVGVTVNEHVNSVVELAERQAEEIRRNAELDAEATRGEVIESAKRVFERINALEVPLGELVETLRLEVATVERELEGEVDAEVTAISEASEDATSEPPVEGNGSAVPAPSPEAAPDVTPSKPKAGKARGRDGRRAESGRKRSRPSEEKRREEQPPFEEAGEEPSPSGKASEDRPEEQRADERESEPHEPAPQSEPAPYGPPTSASAPVEAEEHSEEVEQPQSVMLSPDPHPEAEPPKPDGGTGAGARFSDLLSRFRGEVKSDAFITSEGHCAVCQNAFMAGSEEELRLSDWKVNDDVGLCPNCQSDGWQLPDGANLPFRRGGA